MPQYCHQVYIFGGADALRFIPAVEKSVQRMGKPGRVHYHKKHEPCSGLCYTLYPNQEHDKPWREITS